MATWSLSMSAQLWRDLYAHLFPGDGDEHGAVIAAGVVRTSRGARLLARELHPAVDGLDYLPGERGYRMLTPSFVRDRILDCANDGLSYLAVHNHGGTDAVGFSADDMASHERGYPRSEISRRATLSAPWCSPAMQSRAICGCPMGCERRWEVSGWWVAQSARFTPRRPSARRIPTSPTTGRRGSSATGGKPCFASRRSASSAQAVSDRSSLSTSLDWALDTSLWPIRTGLRRPISPVLLAAHVETPGAGLPTRGGLRLSRRLASGSETEGACSGSSRPSSELEDPVRSRRWRHRRRRRRSSLHRLRLPVPCG